MIATSALSIGCLVFITGCNWSPLRMSAGLQKNTPQEDSYTISRTEPDKACKAVGGFFGYDTPCGSGWSSVTDKVQFSCIRKEITKANGNYGVIDSVIGRGWYKGRIYKCPKS